MTDREEIVVFRIKSRNSRCDDCGDELGKGSLLHKQGERGLCLDCADLGHLYFLPSGDAALTRRASKYSTLRAIVVEWSRSRKHYERQGILVEPEAIERAEEECVADGEERMLRREIAAVRRERIDADYVATFALKIREAFPGMPPGGETAIAERACMKYSGRVGRSADAKTFDPTMIELAVAAHVRHVETGYEKLLNRGIDRDDARASVWKDVRRTLDKWRQA